MSENERAVAGGNNPPTKFDELKTRYDAIVATGDRWVKERPEIIDADMAQRCRSFLDQVQGLAKDLESARREENKPLEDTVKATNARFKPLATALDLIKTTLAPRMAKYLKKLDDERIAREQKALEDARKKQEDADRAAQEAAKSGGIEATVAAQTAAEEAEQAQQQAMDIGKSRAGVKGIAGERAMSIRKIWAVELINVKELPRDVLEEVDQEAILKVLRARVKQGVREIAGAKIFEKESVA